MPLNTPCYSILNHITFNIMHRVLKVNVCKCQYAPPIHIIISSNHNINCTCVSHVYKTYCSPSLYQIVSVFAKTKKKRPSRPKSTVNKTCDVSKLYLKYIERQEKPNYFIIIFFS